MSKIHRVMMRQPVSLLESAFRSETPWIVGLGFLIAAGLWTMPADAQGPQASQHPTSHFGIGTEVEPEVYAAWDIDIPPSGHGLPAGSGSARQGERLFGAQCAGCHTVGRKSADGERVFPNPQGFPKLGYEALPKKSIGSYLPYATTLFDYIRRAMPFPRPQSLQDDEVYALTAYLLAQNEVLGMDAVLDAESLRAIEMPNRHGFTSPDPRPDTDSIAYLVDPTLENDGGGDGDHVALRTAASRTPRDHVLPAVEERRVEHEILNAGHNGTGTQVRVATHGSRPATSPRPEPMRSPERGTVNVPVALPFDVRLVQIDVGMPTGLHSYSAAVAKSGSWLLIGGRTNGLHRTTSDGPSFPKDSRNHKIWAVDPERGRVASVSLDGLPELLQDALTSSDQQYAKDKDSGLLWISGGYGWNSQAGEYGTFGLLIAIQVEELVAAIFAHNGNSVPGIERYFSYGLPDDGCEFFGATTAGCNTDLVVTGGGLKFMDGDLVLALGNRFGGEYNYTSELKNQQYYSCQVLRFAKPVPSWGGTFEVTGITVLGSGGGNCAPGENGNADDPFHRRDLNVVPVIRPGVSGDEEGIAIYGGVFTANFSGHGAPMLIDSRGVEIRDDAAQTLCHYEAASVGLFDAETRSMHTLILGGMGAGYCTEAEQDAETPQCTRSDTIVPPAFMEDGTLLSWSIEGSFSQALLSKPFRQPDPDANTGLLGTNAHFLARPKLATYANGVIQLDRLPEDRYTSVGYVFGGLATDGEAPRNVFFSDGPSWASDLAFEVLIKPKG